MRTSLKWLGVVLAIGLISLAASAKTYLASVNRREVQVAQQQTGGVNLNPYSLGGFTEAGKLKIYAINWGFKFTFSGVHNQVFLVEAAQNQTTDFAVQPGEVITVLMQYSGGIHKPYGWVKPDDPVAGICSQATASTILQATNRGESIVSVQCWNDDDASDDNFDDFEVVITQVPGTGTVSSPSPGTVASPSPGTGASCLATAPTGLAVVQGTSNNQSVATWYQGTKGSLQLIRVGTDQAEVLSGCQGSPTTCVVNSSAAAYTRPANPATAQQMWFFTTGTAFGHPVHTCIQTAGAVGSPGYTSITTCENNINVNVSGWVGKTSGVCYLSEAACKQNSFGSLTVDGLAAGQTYYYRIVNYLNDTCRPEMVVSFTNGGTASPSPAVSASPVASVSPKPSVSPSPGSGGNAASASPAASGQQPSQPDTGSPTWLTAGALLTGLSLLMIKLLLKI